MKKISVEFLITAFLFIGIWFGFSQINWISLFNVNEISQKTEEKLGELTWEYLSNSENEIDDEDIFKSVDSLLQHLSEFNSLDNQKIKLHIVNSNDINTFALPDGHLVLNSQLIIECKNQEELLGVIAHELAHIHLNHIIKKIAKEIGLAVVITATTGNSEIVGEIAHTLSSTAFSRIDEEEADLQAVLYLEKGNIDPVPFSDFLFRLSNENDTPKYMSWLSTHPDSKDRAQYVNDKISSYKSDYKKVINPKTFENIQVKLSNLE